MKLSNLCGFGLLAFAFAAFVEASPVDTQGESQSSSWTLPSH